MNMKRLFTVFTGLLILASCCTINIDTSPKFTGVDPRVKKIYDEYMKLSGYKHIEFSDTVTIGFGNTKIEHAVGLCTTTPLFREITIDEKYWNRIGKLQRVALLYHELTHCYCDRNHDYGKGKPYPAPKDKWYDDDPPAPEGSMFADGCPITLMYPRVISDDCMKRHYGEYVEEMFDRCEPF